MPTFVNERRNADRVQAKGGDLLATKPSSYPQLQGLTANPKAKARRQPLASTKWQLYGRKSATSTRIPSPSKQNSIYEDIRDVRASKSISRKKKTR